MDEISQRVAPMSQICKLLNLIEEIGAIDRDQKLSYIEIRKRKDATDAACNNSAFSWSAEEERRRNI
jgi:hypothetical protein